MVASKQVKAKKNGEPYLALMLADRTGEIEAKMWDNVDEFITIFEQDDFLKIKGLINKYKNRFQLTVHKLRQHGRSRYRFHRLPSQDHQGYWRALENADGIRCYVPESPTLTRWSNCSWRTRRLPNAIATPRGQDPASCLHRRTARSRGVVVAAPAI